VDPAREWNVFVAGTFALMGASLIAGAERRAADAVVWENERRRVAGAEAVACDGPFLGLQLRLNRGIGAVLLAGAVLLGSGRFARFENWRPSGAVAGLLAAALIASAAAGAAAHLLGRRPVPRFVQEEHGAASVPPAERAAEWISWTLRAWWLAYGARLLMGLRG
jgi:hypothetical protein